MDVDGTLGLVSGSIRANDYLSEPRPFLQDPLATYEPLGSAWSWTSASPFPFFLHSFKSCPFLLIGQQALASSSTVDLSI